MHAQERLSRKIAKFNERAVNDQYIQIHGIRFQNEVAEKSLILLNSVYSMLENNNNLIIIFVYVV